MFVSDSTAETSFKRVNTLKENNALHSLATIKRGNQNDKIMEASPKTPSATKG